MKEKRVLCILVLYKPNVDLLYHVISSVINQVETLWISDNTPGGFSAVDDIRNKYCNKLIYHKMNGNEGIAKAQNKGIRYAVDSRYDFVYFLDQDSISPDNIVKGLLRMFLILESKGYKVGGVGPQPFNRDTGKAYLPNIHKGSMIENNVKQVTELISSASLISVNLFKEVGSMDEKLFIDAVDHELCWRSTYQAGYCFFMITSLLLSHKLGQKDKRFMGITVRVPAPVRCYYLYRNYFLLINRNYIPLYWKISNGVKFFCKLFYFPLFCIPRLEYFTYINRGIWDGLFIRKGGKIYEQ